MVKWRKKVGDDGSDVCCVEGEISYVVTTNEYASCKFCSCNVQSEDGVIGRCSKCNAAFKISKCAVTANVKVVIEGGNTKKYTVMIFEPILLGMVLE